MERKLDIWVMGGDLRQLSLARQLAVDGHSVHIYALDAISLPTPELISEATLSGTGQADCVLFPMPPALEGMYLNAPLSAHRHPLLPLLDALSSGSFLCGGRIDPHTLQLFHARGLTPHDYFAREELAVANAVPTAEGAVQLAMEHLPITIHGARVLVIGFGRVGRVTAQRFQVLGARVTVAARSCEQLAWVQAMGMWQLHLNALCGDLASYDLILNTVPAAILTKAILAALRPDCLILDLASEPGGVDFASAQDLGLHAIHALALPGKVAPVTAASAIKQTIYHMLRESGRLGPGKEGSS